MSAATEDASQPSDRRRPGKAGGTVAVRRTLVSTICQIADLTQVSRPRQLHDASTVMRLRPAHQSMINRRFNDRASCPARKSPKPALARKPRIHSPASDKGGHESGQNATDGTVSHQGFLRVSAPLRGTKCHIRTTRSQKLPYSYFILVDSARTTREIAKSRHFNFGREVLLQISCRCSGE
jgi:hypothetical protein